MMPGDQLHHELFCMGPVSQDGNTTGSYTEAVGRICDSKTRVSTRTGAHGRGNLGFLVLVVVRPVKSTMVRGRYALLAYRPTP
jgi:hypothetical protein